MNEPIKEAMSCLSRTGHDTPATGKPSEKPTLNGPATSVKEAQPIPTATPDTANPIPLPEAKYLLLSPTLTTTPDTVSLIISVSGASDAIPHSTKPTTPKRGNANSPSNSITATPPCLNGVTETKPTNKDLMDALRGDELGLQLHQIQLEAYKPAMDALKLYLEIYGSRSPNFYRTKNIQVAATCQMNGLNDPDATRKQRIAAMTCYELIYETIMQAVELGLEQSQTKERINEAITSAGEFFNLGNKKAVAARNKANRKGKGK